METVTVDPSMESSPKPLRWPFFLSGGLIALSLLVAGASTVELPYYSWSPGPAYEVDDLVTVPEPDPVDGEFYMLTVSVSASQVTPIEFAIAQFDSSIDLIATERLRGDQTDEEYRENNRRSMDESKATAIFVALDYLGIDVTIKGDGVLVAGLTEGSPVVGLLEEGDVITAVDGRPVMISSDLTGIISEYKAGDRVVLTLLRNDVEETITVTLVEHVTDPSRPMIGFLATTSNWSYETPFDVDIDATNVGGPSAGLMYSLTLIDLLSEDDLARGHVIAGTGTISVDGTVGAIGGIKQKVVGAAAAGAEYILIPADNWEQAAGVEANIQKIRVATLQDALDFLATLAPA
ncbi:MAG: PDZ domain-containing protein [Acidimicrobiia bacterium]|nr:PDZ domain-containing protein [Acidimicrobiia bacterium]